MKKLSKIISLIIVVVTVSVALVACSSYGKLEKSFVSAGYEINQDFTAVADGIKQELEQDEYAVDVHMFTKTSNKITSALIVEFKTTKELVKAYKENQAIKDLVKNIKDDEDINKVYAALEEAGYVKGNCIVIPLSLLYINEITGIVKGA